MRSRYRWDGRQQGLTPHSSDEELGANSSLAVFDPAHTVCYVERTTSSALGVVGSNGASGAALTANEFDGYLLLDNGKGARHQPAVARAAAEGGRDHGGVGDNSGRLAPGDGRPTNTGAGTAQLDAYALLAESPQIPRGPLGAQSPTPDIESVGINTFPVPAGFCSANASFLWTFAVDTWQDQSHVLPVSHQVWLDTNRDASGPDTIADGRQLAWALNLATSRSA